jgi:hypothetical protein
MKYQYGSIGPSFLIPHQKTNDDYKLDQADQINNAVAEPA